MIIIYSYDCYDLYVCIMVFIVYSKDSIIMQIRGLAYDHWNLTQRAIIQDVQPHGS